MLFVTKQGKWQITQIESQKIKEKIKIGDDNEYEALAGIFF